LRTARASLRPSIISDPSRSPPAQMLGAFYCADPLTDAAGASTKSRRRRWQGRNVLRVPYAVQRCRARLLFCIAVRFWNTASRPFVRCKPRPVILSIGVIAAAVWISLLKYGLFRAGGESVSPIRPRWSFIFGARLIEARLFSTSAQAGAKPACACSFRIQRVHAALRLT
jgi:hypothetical protein